MANAEGANLKELFDPTFEWLVQNGDHFLATGVEPELAPDGLPIVKGGTKHSLTLSAVEVWAINPNAAQILGVDDKKGKLELGAHEESYLRRDDGTLSYDQACIYFWVEYAAGHLLSDSIYSILQSKNNKLESCVDHAYRNGADRDLFVRTTELTGVETEEERIGERQFGALTSIMNALKEHWPEIKAARAAAPIQDGEIPPST